MNISFCTPYAIDRNLGKAYNDCVNNNCKSLNDWVFLIDGDVMFLTPDWGKHIHDIVEANPDAGIITCLTNRVNNLLQCYNNEISNEPHMLHHYKISKDLHDNRYWETTEIRRVISGMMFGFSRKTWEEVGGFFEIPSRIIGVDTRFSFKVRNLGKKIIMANGIYCFHYYRLHEKNPSQSNSHLI